MDSAIPDGGKTSTAKGTKIETGEQASKPAEEKTDTGGDTKMHGEDKPPKAMATEKAKAKTAPKTKPAGKAKTKTKAAEKTKAKTAEKKEKAAAKKTVKAPSKKRESEQPKAKSSLSDSQKKNDEL